MLMMPAGSDDAQRARAEARADLIRRLFAVAVSVGFAATLARMAWVQNGTLPNPAELNQTLILGTALVAAILGWDGHLVEMTDLPLFGLWRFLTNLALVFIYMFLLMASGHPECMLWTLAVIFALYMVWDVLTMREQISSYDPALAGTARATAAQIWSVYAGGFTGAGHVAPGPAIKLAWTCYFVLLAIIGNGRAYAHIRTSCVLALIGLVGFWIDATSRQDDGARDHPMRRRILVILGTLIAATIYFRLRPGV
jgi:hypothetical protein